MAQQLPIIVATTEVAAETVHGISVVIPVYQGERTLARLIAEVEPLTQNQLSPAGHAFRVVEVILVHDGAVDGSAQVMEWLAQRHAFVRTTWLSRNYGQHAATIAGMAGTSAPWVVTLDEDGQHDPREIGRLLDVALDEEVQLVYARPSNAPPHGRLRNLGSGFAKRVFRSLLEAEQLGSFHSFRLVSGEVARSLAAYCSNSVYLDVALSWVVASTGHCPMAMREENGHRSGYRFGSLLRHFGRMVITSGTRPLRLISWMGACAIVVAMAIAGYAVYGKLTGRIPVQGWTSTVMAICFFSGCILFALGLIAEYIGTALSVMMGKPLYVTVSRPARVGARR